MIQIGLSLLLLVQALLGQSLCCCALPRITLPWSKAVQTETPSCCGAHNDADQAPEKPDAPKAPCPCRESQTKAPDLLAPPATDEVLRPASVLDQPILVASTRASGTNGHAATEPILDLAFVTTKDLLRAHHVLRC